ncbi:coenzyme F390 synthetase [Methanomethylovorans hollandica DSM 15978]|uniref:Coenzyme F390 synthetase n=1 Tax=Methanomethylovorans hollandica (strain DSM 15978 / NBRC 107637 / DMS1) TaxID=867904 RepID=L0KZT5_METHD|nr:coenzyme F390 synthetase [Methanomethylovorans hollandica]AGB49613.1 coenzyme F390 synthetase [Methanomethylovorans hollandica DSM 15978]
MPPGTYHNPSIETMERGELDALIDERIQYTVQYAAEKSPFYRKWFKEHKISPSDIKSHEDLLELPIINGSTIREHQPPVTGDFEFRTGDWNEIFTIHETSGTSGTPKAFFLTWEDWERYAEKYARYFVAQGFEPGDRVVICASYGMNVGANTMTLGAHHIGMTIIPTGKCTFPTRIVTSYKPTGIVGSVFKLLRLGKNMKEQGLDPSESSIRRLVVGGESFAEEARNYLSEMWDCEVYNNYGSTEGTMCGECTDFSGLHVSEDMVHLDVYDPGMDKFVKDGECGRMVLSTLLPVGARSGTLLLNYDTEDTTVVMSRKTCACGRTHMKIMNPQREAETFWVAETPFNRVDVEKGVFQRENMEYLTGEYEAFLYGGDDEEETVMRVSLECLDPATCDRSLVEENFLSSFFRYKKKFENAYNDESFKILFNYTAPGALELYRIKGRPKRIVDRR